jgi:AraC-like DNA-binding protein
MPKITLLIISLLFLFICTLVIMNGGKKDFPNRYFNLAFFVLSIFFLFRLVLFEFEAILIYPHFIRTISPLMFLPAPLFYLGTRQLILKKFTFHKKHFLHFLPAIFHGIELIPFFLKSSEEKREIAQQMISDDLGWMINTQSLIPSIWIDLLRFMLMVIYLIISWKTIYSSGIFRLNNSFPKLNPWVKPSLVYFGIVQVLFLIQYISNFITYLFNQNLNIIRNLNIIVIFTGMMLYIIHLLLKIKIHFGTEEKNQLPTFFYKNNLILKNANSQVLEKSKISKEDLSVIEEKLNRLFNEEKIYINQNLMVKDLADMINISPRILPEIFTELYGKSFKDYVNYHRINFAKLKIEENYLKSCTIDSLAEISGFNSRITLYNVFKKEFLISPTDYWKNIQKITFSDDKCNDINK